jgi:Lrp/AsnC family transcriptional regulator, leucine-responsive regulatory protein
VHVVTHEVELVVIGAFGRMDGELRGRQPEDQRRVAILDPQSVCGRQLAIVLVTLEEPSSQDDASLRARLLATPEVQQCYDVAGEWDYVVVLVTSGMHECRELVERLLLDEPAVKRLVTLPVFDTVKLGLDIPVRRVAGR